MVDSGGAGVGTKRTDPELLRQLDEALKSGKPVAAVVSLHRPAGKAPKVETIEAKTRAAIKRVTETTGEEPDDVHVMGRVGVAYVTGPARFVQELVDQPEVYGAVANEKSADRSEQPEAYGAVANEESADRTEER